MQIITLYTTHRLSGKIRHLPASKSISNRVLILDALAGGGSDIQNLSEANDTRLMKELLQADSTLLNAEDAGTTMRFLTAYCAVRNGIRQLTGSARMKQRPIGILVEALRTLGAEIHYLENEGYPPLQVQGITHQQTATVAVRGDVSSQFISALMMIGPALPQGLILNLQGPVGSRPYINMTAALMQKFGAAVELSEDRIAIAPAQYKPTSIKVETDWSAASYWFAFAALAPHSEILLPDMTLRSIQGDRVIASWMENLGVACQPRGNDLLVMHKPDAQQEVAFDFTHCPDLAQTIAVVCAARNIKATFTGLESLRIKETDRIAALQKELRKLGASFTEQGNAWQLIPAPHLPEAIEPICTYNDHRMAMAFAPVAALRTLHIENPQVVKKSYPRFWDDVRHTGIVITGL